MRTLYRLNTKRRRMVALAIIGGLLILGGTIWLQRALQNYLTVENRSGQPVSLLMIGVYGSSSGVHQSPSCFMFQNVPDRSKLSAALTIDGDGGFYVHGFLADGTYIKGGYHGYVTNGIYREQARFVIKPGGGLD